MIAYTIQVIISCIGGDDVDYYEIGQRIRRIRKSRGLSQEQLAELVGISTTHMSHIETANTKLSLPVFIQIAEVLEVQTDTLLYDQPRDSVDSSMSTIAAVLESCDAKQARFIAEMVKAAKQSMDIYL